MDYNAICMGFGGRLTSFREKRIVKSAKNVVRMRKVLSDNDLNGKNKNVGGNHEKVSAEHPGGVLHGALPYAHGGVRRRRADDHQHRRGGVTRTQVPITK